MSRFGVLILLSIIVFVALLVVALYIDCKNKLRRAADGKSSSVHWRAYNLRRWRGGVRPSMDKYKGMSEYFEIENGLSYP